MSHGATVVDMTATGRPAPDGAQRYSANLSPGGLAVKAQSRTL